MKIHLHIGTHKTGTTAIQHFAMENRSLLLRYGVYWPSEQLKPHRWQHSVLARLLADGQQDQVEAFIDRSLAEAEDAGAQSLFLSGEDFCGMDGALAGRFVKLFERHELEVIVYFRNIYDYAASAFTQHIKTHHRLAPLEQIVGSIRNGLDYSGVIERWEQLVPADKVQVRSYDQVKRELLPAFFTALGVPAEAVLPHVPATAKARNDSLDFATQLLLSATGYNTSSKDYHETRQLYGNLFSDMNFEPPASRLIATALCSGNTAKLDHCRLAPIRDLLTQKPDEPEHDIEAIADYLDRLSRFAAKLARRKKGGLKARFGLKRGRRNAKEPSG